MPSHSPRSRPAAHRSTGRSPRSLKTAATALTAALAAALCLTGLTGAATPAAASSPSLKSLAESKGIYFGGEITQDLLSNSTATSLAGSQFDMITPGNEMKWDTTEPSQGNFNFGPGDAIVNFAQANGMKVRGHNLVWYSQLPSWVSNLPSGQVQSAMENHITTEATHYKGEVYSWDVVNEPFNDDGSYRGDAFYNAMGSGYIADALRTAHAADPGAKLYINDYNIEGENAKSNALYSLVQQLKSQGVPIDGVGFESHFIVGQLPTDLQANMARFTALGVNVAVTELDDRMPTPPSTGNLTQQATDDAYVVQACLATNGCVGVSQWAVGDADSWVPGFFSGYGAATLFDSNYQPKPSFNAVVNALGGSSGGATGPIVGYGGLCLDDRAASTADLNPIQVYTCNGTTAQQWTVNQAGNTLRVLGKCLDVNGGGTADGTTVDLYTCNNTGAQVWMPQSNGSLYNPQSGKCLDDSGWSTTPGTQAQIWDCSTNANQQWKLPS
ncbi:endo-1,4-beta-xylanase [Kitasatospora kifunensis]|uniref:Beta-xylanase n=1 Tax=Kitasatospora kifunensis TaxID=58351 RepID=A0A7W7RB34_KITKI|nr:endo-1,4-beta-xylanase [Kitasatospora kifunensis]MBB4928091.1 endo-1,4-beta-xylanase [Kitasatospora kifunensis]